MIACHSDLVLGIDVGTSGLRIAALDRDGGLVQMTAADSPAPERQAGRVTQEARVWRRALHEAMAAMAAALDPARVRAIAVDGTSGTVLAIDPAGAPLGPASLYNDLAPPAIVETIARVGDASSAAQGPSSALGRAIELARRFPSAARIVHRRIGSPRNSPPGSTSATRAMRSRPATIRWRAPGRPGSRRPACRGGSSRR